MKIAYSDLSRINSPELLSTLKRFPRIYTWPPPRRYANITVIRDKPAAPREEHEWEIVRFFPGNYLTSVPLCDSGSLGYRNMFIYLALSAHGETSRKLVAIAVVEEVSGNRSIVALPRPSASCFLVIFWKTNYLR